MAHADHQETDSTPSLSDGPELEHKSKGSRFLGQVFSASELDQADAILQRVRKRHHSATHHCWAIRLRPQSEPFERAEDDGEPSSTAGAPLLGALQRCNVYDALVVVTRYFGGTKLGRGGLVKAYGETARLAVDAAPPRTLWHDVILSVGCGYGDLGSIETVLARHVEPIQLVHRNFDAEPVLTVVIRRSAAEVLLRAIVEATAGRARVEALPERD